jgi:hypothetical protein
MLYLCTKLVCRLSLGLLILQRLAIVDRPATGRPRPVVPSKHVVHLRDRVGVLPSCRAQFHHPLSRPGGCG